MDKIQKRAKSEKANLNEMPTAEEFAFGKSANQPPILENYNLFASAAVCAKRLNDS